MFEWNEMMVWSEGKFYFSHKQSEQIIVTDNYIYECERSSIAEWMNCIDIFKYLFLYDCWSPFGRMLLFIAAILCKHTHWHIGIVSQFRWINTTRGEIYWSGILWQAQTMAIFECSWRHLNLNKNRNVKMETRCNKNETKAKNKRKKTTEKNTNVTSIFAQSLNKKSAAATVIIATATATDCIRNQLPRGKRT